MQIKFGKILHLRSFWKWEFVGYKSRPQDPVAAISKKEKTLGTMLLTCIMADSGA